MNNFPPPPVLRRQNATHLGHETNDDFPPRPVLRRQNAMVGDDAPRQRRRIMTNETNREKLKREIYDDYDLVSTTSSIRSFLRSNGAAGVRELNNIKENIINSYARVRNDFYDDPNVQNVIDELVAAIPIIDKLIASNPNIDPEIIENNNYTANTGTSVPEHASNYENKYLKYKQKYLELKKKMK